MDEKSVVGIIIATVVVLLSVNIVFNFWDFGSGNQVTEDRRKLQKIGNLAQNKCDAIKAGSTVGNPVVFPVEIKKGSITLQEIDEDGYRLRISFSDRKQSVAELEGCEYSLTAGDDATIDPGLWSIRLEGSQSPATVNIRAEEQ